MARAKILTVKSIIYPLVKFDDGSSTGLSNIKGTASLNCQVKWTKTNGYEVIKRK